MASEVGPVLVSLKFAGLNDGKYDGIRGRSCFGLTNVCRFRMMENMTASERQVLVWPHGCQYQTRVYNCIYIYAPY